MTKTSRKTWLTSSSSVQFHLIPSTSAMLSPQTCTYSKTSSDPSQIISMSRLQLQRFMPRDPWRANCSEVQPVLGTSLPCKDLSDLPNSPLPRISAHSGTLPRLDWGIHPPYFHHQAGSSSACPRHPVIRVCLDLQCQVRNSNHQFAVGLPQG